MSRIIKTLQAVMMKEDGQAPHLPAQQHLQGVKTPQNKLGRAPCEARFDLQEAKAMRKGACSLGNKTKSAPPPDLFQVYGSTDSRWASSGLRCQASIFPSRQWPEGG